MGRQHQKSRVSCVVLKPQVWRQKIGLGPVAAARTPYLNKGRGHRAPGVGGHCVGGFMLQIFFPFVAVVFLLFFSFFFPFFLFFLPSLLFSFFLIYSVCSIQQPSAWQSLAAIPTRPFPIQMAPVNFYNPALKLQARLLLPALGYLFAQPVWPPIFHMCVTPALASTSFWPLKCQ